MTSGCISYALFWGSVGSFSGIQCDLNSIVIMQGKEIVYRLFQEPPEKAVPSTPEDCLRSDEICILTTRQCLVAVYPSQSRHIAMVLYMSLLSSTARRSVKTDTQTWQCEQWVISLPLWFNLSHWFHLRCHLENKITMDYSLFLINSNTRSFTCSIEKRPLHIIQHMILHLLFSIQTLFAQ